MATTRNVPEFMNIVKSSRPLVSPGASKKTLVGRTVRASTTLVYSTLEAAAITSPPTRDRSTHAAVTEST